MKKLSVLLFTIVTFLSVKAQNCTPFLGGDRVVIACSNPFTINYNDLFITDANFVITVVPLTPEEKLELGPDTIKILGKTEAVATRSDGCTDKAFVRVLKSSYPLPNLGADSTVRICLGKKVDISGFYETFGYESFVWGTPTPESVDIGKYTLTVRTGDGCTDAATVTVDTFPKPRLGNDKVLTILASQTQNLTVLYNTQNLESTWSAINPTAAPPDIYELVVTNGDGCTDTAIVTICKKPELGPDINRGICEGSYLNLNTLFENLWNYKATWSTVMPYAAPVGNYTLTVVDRLEGCTETDEANVKLTSLPRPHIIDRDAFICEGSGANITDLYTLTGLTAIWSLADPETAPVGIHKLMVENASHCKDTAFITVQPFDRPAFLNDTTVRICGGITKNLDLIYPLSENFNQTWEGVNNPLAAPAGTYTLHVYEQESGCDMDVTTVVLPPGASLGELNLCLYQQPDIQAFTTNRFRSIVADKQGNIWAGADGQGAGGGIYKFTRKGPDCGQGEWKGTTLQAFMGTSFRDLHISNIEGDNTLWCASIGNSVATANTGGVYHIADLQNIQRYGSVAGDGSLSSTFAQSLAISPNHKLLVALGQSLARTEADSNVTVVREGGCYEYDMLIATPAPGGFTAIPNIKNPLPLSTSVSAVGTRGDEVWIAVQKSTAFDGEGVFLPAYINRWNTATNSSNGNTAIPFFAPDNNLRIQAIFTNQEGRTFLGMADGLGFAVVEPELPETSPVWTLVNSDNSALPPGASINANAITEVNGEIWMGTNSGLLVYDGVGSITDCKSYTLYNTSNGLPSNNVTDVAYDAANMEVWFTTDNGICRFKQTQSISGNVKNVFCGLNEKILMPFIGRKFFPAGSVAVSLLDKAGNVLETTTTNATGEFTLVKGVAGPLTVKISYGGLFNYEYSNIKANAYLGDILIPDSLIKELAQLKPLLKERNFMFKLPFELKFAEYGEVAEGYDLNAFEVAYLAFTQGVIKSDHSKKVENIANYYVTLATIYNMGINYAELKGEGGLAITDFVLALYEMSKLYSSLGKFNQTLSDLQGTAGENEGYKKQLDKQLDKLTWAIIKEFKNIVLLGSNATIRASLSTADKKTYDDWVGRINQGLDVIIKYKETTAGEKIGDVFEDLIKKVIQNMIAGFFSSHYYTKYCQEIHNNVVGQLADQCRNAASPEKYLDVYLRNYDIRSPQDGLEESLNLKSTNTFNNTKDFLKLMKDASKSSEGAAKILDAASKVAAATVVLAPIAPELRAAALALQGLNFVFIGTAIGKAFLKSSDIATLSENAAPNAGFTYAPTPSPVSQLAPTLLSTSSLSLASNNYNKKLLDLKNLVQAQPVDSFLILKISEEVYQLDSIYTDELLLALNEISPLAGGAEPLSGIEENLHTLLDTTLHKRSGEKMAFFMQMASYLRDSVKLNSVPGLIVFIDGLVLLNKHSTESLSNIASSASNYGIHPDAWLVQEKYDISSTFQPDSAGIITHYFKNYGKEPQMDVSFKITPPTAEFTINGPDSFFVGTIQPGETKPISFHYTAPSFDTVGNYDIIIAATNGHVPQVGGSMLAYRFIDESIANTIQNGLWSSPATWSTNQIPTSATAVTITHDVIVDIDAECLSLKAVVPGKVHVNAGKKLTINK